jgi:hypothetical protein
MRTTLTAPAVTGDLKKVLVAGTIAFALIGAQATPAFAKNPSAPGQMKKLGAALEHVHKTDKKRSEARAAGERGVEVAIFSDEDYVVVDSVATGATADLVATLNALGAKNVSSYGRIVSAQVPVSRLGDLAGSSNLAFARPALAEVNVGLITSQGDRSMRTNEVRMNTGFDGTGMTIGVLSDSFSCTTGPIGPNGWTSTAQDIANNDLPPNVVILSDIASGCIDEGRGMAQLIHDSAPGASIAFHTAFNGMADFANGIVDLALAGSDVVVDDVIYFAEPMFQDGIIAQAADEVHRLGVPYYSSNGNRARTAHRTDYRAVNATNGGISGTWHDFDPGAGVDTLQAVGIASAGGLGQTTLSFQWDEPNFSVSGAPGSASDVDVVMFDSAGNPAPNCFDEDGNQVVFTNICFFQSSDGGVGGDAIELFNLVSFNPGTTLVQIGFLAETGPAPNLVMHVPFVRQGAFGEFEWATNSGSGFGHNNAAGAEGVGASAFNFTEEFIGDPQTNNFAGTHCIPACLNDFSSAGGTPIVFDIEGNRLATPEVRLKPGLTGPDGTNTTFFISDSIRDDDDADGAFGGADPGEFPNFFGTSAAAPHAASVAALLLDSEGSEILQVKKNGQVKYHLCKLKKNKPGRANGTDVTVAPPAVPAQLNNGAVLGPCSRTEPAEVFAVMRDTAQNMTTRVNTNTGVPIAPPFTEVGPGGFDFDSGFGFIDAVEALNEFDD